MINRIFIKGSYKCYDDEDYLRCCYFLYVDRDIEVVCLWEIFLNIVNVIWEDMFVKKEGGVYSLMVRLDIKDFSLRMKYWWGEREEGVRGCWVGLLLIFDGKMFFKFLFWKFKF